MSLGHFFLIKQELLTKHFISHVRELVGDRDRVVREREIKNM